MPVQVAVYISPHRVQVGDRGLVVVGASVHRGDVASGDGLAGDWDDEDIIRAEVREEEERKTHMRSAGGCWCWGCAGPGVGLSCKAQGSVRGKSQCGQASE